MIKLERLLKRLPIRESNTSRYLKTSCDLKSLGDTLERTVTFDIARTAGVATSYRFDLFIQAQGNISTLASCRSELPSPSRS